MMKQVIYDLRKLIGLQFIFSTLWTLTNVCLPYMNMILFNHVGHLTLKLVIFLCIGYFSLILANSFFQDKYQSLEWKISAEFRRIMQTRLFRKILSQSNRNYQSHTQAGYLAIFTNNIEVLDEEYLSPFIDMLRAMIEIIFYTGALILFVDWKIAAVVLLASLLASVLPKYTAEKLATLRKNQLAAYEQYVKHLSTFLKGKSLFTPFTFLNLTKRHDYYAESNQGSLYDYGRFKTFANVMSGLAMFIVNFLAFVMVAVLLYRKELSVGAAVATFSYVTNFVYPIRYILTDVNALHASKKARHEMENWLQAEEMLIRNQAKYQFESLEICDLNLQTSEGKQLFKHLNLKLLAGDKVALVGPNASGKSTLLQYIYQREASAAIIWNQGKVQENEIDDFVEYVGQESVVFEDTVANNLTLFGSYPLKRELLAYLPVDFDENSYLSPETMSGGEKQMIALLRALHANKGLLLLDEPFAALSKEMSEKYTDLLLQEKELTVLMITHDKRVNYLEQFQQIWQVEHQNIKIIVDEKN